MIRPLLQSSKLARDSTRTELISATSGALATVLTVVVELRGGLTGAGVAEVIVDVPRGGAGECVGGGGAGGVRVAVEDGVRVGSGGELDGLAGRTCGLDVLGGGVGVCDFVDLAVLELVCWVWWGAVSWLARGGRDIAYLLE